MYLYINKNIFINLLVNVSRRILFFRKLLCHHIAPALEPEPKPESAPVLPSSIVASETTFILLPPSIISV